MTLKLGGFSEKIGNNHATWIYNNIREGMAPFELKMIEIYCDFDIDFNQYRVLGAAILRNGYTIEFVERVDAWDLAAKPDHEMRRVAEAMKVAFRNRFDWPLPNNIELGEN